MKIEKGKLIIEKNKQGKFFGRLEINGKMMPLPHFYAIKSDTLNGSECEITRNKGQVEKVVVDGRELPRKDHSAPAGASRGNTPFPGRRAEEAGRNHSGGPVEQPRGRAPAARQFNPVEALLPRDTKAVMPRKVDNYGLWLNKAAPFEKSEDKLVFKFYQKDRNGNEIFLEPDFSGLDFGQIRNRRRLALAGTDLTIRELSAVTTWRMALGLGHESVYETSLTLHPLYGFPYIPGSAVKGSVRSAVIAELFGGEEDAALKDEVFCLLFGNPKVGEKGSRRGRACFFDAFPAGPPRVAPDIMNPHYAEYYRDKEGKLPPGDYYNPIPVFFLTVKDTEFVFFVGIREVDNCTVQSGEWKGQTLLEVVEAWLTKTLTCYGIGAKSAVGYGYFVAAAHPSTY